LSGQVVLARITELPLDPAECIAKVSTSRAGGLGVFLGAVRDHDHGRPVRSLAYEAHPSAEDSLVALCREAAARDVVSVGAVHRVGELAIGELAVVVAVGAAHRAEALDTTRWLIDAIKAEVPIWKRQIFTDGTDEWVGACG